MTIFLNISFALVLLVVLYQDLKMRLIHVTLPIVILVLTLALKWPLLNVVEVIYSLSFLAFNFVLVTFYFSIKHKQFTNPFKTMFGLGDLLFLLALIPFFTFRNYLLFFVMGMLFALILHRVLKAIYPIEKSIPLAGYLSLFMLGVMGINIFFNHQFLQ